MTGAGSYILCPSCAGKRHRLEDEPLQKRQCSGGAGSSTGSRTCENEAERVPSDVYVPESIDDAMFHGTVHSRDQVLRLQTQYGSIKDLRYSSRKLKRSQ